MSDRVLCLIDGFNYFHRLDDYYEKTQASLKWLNYASLVNEQVGSIKLMHNKERRKLSLERIIFFTSLDKRGRESFTQEQKRQRKFEKHKTYIRALESVGIEIVYGKFNYSTVECGANGCSNAWIKPSEKMTDVNIAITLLDSAYQNSFDVCFLFTGDTDLIPAVKAVKNRFSEKEIVVFQPPDCKFTNQEGKRPGHNLRIKREFKKLEIVTHHIFSFTDFKRHQFDNTLVHPTTKEKIVSPYANPNFSSPQ